MISEMIPDPRKRILSPSTRLLGIVFTHLRKLGDMPVKMSPLARFHHGKNLFNKFRMEVTPSPPEVRVGLHPHLMREGVDIKMVLGQLHGHHGITGFKDLDLDLHLVAK